MTDRFGTNKPFVLILLFLLATALLLLPGWTPRFPEPPTKKEASLTEAPVARSEVLNRDLWHALFDLSTLPEAEINEPPKRQPDPTAALKRWQLTGIILQDEEPLITVANGSNWHVLKVNEKLEGFVFTGVDNRKALFTKDGPIIELQLPESPSG